MHYLFSIAASAARAGSAAQRRCSRRTHGGRPALATGGFLIVVVTLFHTTFWSIWWWSLFFILFSWRAQRTYWYAQRTFCLIFLIFHHMSPASAQKVLKMTFFEVYVVHQKRIKKKIIRSICTEKKSLQFDRRNSWLSSYWKCSYKKKIQSGGFLTID